MEDIAPRNHRLEKISQLIKEEVGKIILKELDIDNNLLLTITQVTTSSDLGHATISVSTILKEREQEMLDELHHRAGDIQYILNRKLRMRPVPRIRFAIDTTYEKEQRLYDILAVTEKEEHDANDH